MIVVLRFLHGSGCVHRDISSGNVYLFDEHGVPGDLEYAKKNR
jgi:serine/threonine protein kinase